MAYKYPEEKEEGEFILRGLEESKLCEFQINFQEKGKLNTNCKSIIPTYNFDKLYFTPAFFLPLDKKYYLHNETFEKFQFKQKIERTKESFSKDKINKIDEYFKVPAPNSTYCQICKQNFDNYLEHTNKETHLQTANNNPINTDIKELCATFRNKKDKKHTKQKFIKKPFRNQKKETEKQSKLVKQDISTQGSQSLAKAIDLSPIIIKELEEKSIN